MGKNFFPKPPYSYNFPDLTSMRFRIHSVFKRREEKERRESGHKTLRIRMQDLPDLRVDGSRIHKKKKKERCRLKKYPDTCGRGPCFDSNFSVATLYS